MPYDSSSYDCVLTVQVGFQPATYTVQENISPNPFQVCVRLLEGQLAMNQFVRVALTLVPGTAQGERCDGVKLSTSLMALTTRDYTIINY